MIDIDELKPNWRKQAGIFIMIAEIALLAFIIGSLSQYIGKWPLWLQLPFYLIAGIIWIVPLRPLLIWMETGKWRG